MAFQKTSQPAFFGTSALLFAASAALTSAWSGSMSAMRSMPMPGGWKMSMAWMRMPGRTWMNAEARFVAMWAAMMVAMMLPSLAPVLWRHRQAICNAGGKRLNRRTAQVAAGYFSVWTVLGIFVFPVGAALAQAGMDRPSLARVVPIATGAVITAAGAFQLTGWKAHHLACCRAGSGLQGSMPDVARAWRYGLRLGLHCLYGCAGFTAILLAAGVMDLRIMTLITAAITAERLAPNGKRIAQAIGVAVVAVGLLLMARAAVAVR